VVGQLDRKDKGKIMALTATITKFSVNKRPGHNDFECTINVEIVNESAVVLLEKKYSERYNSDTSIGTIKANFQSRIVSDWNQYEGEQTIFDAAAFDTLVGELQTAANTYVNQ
jgi:hypothetical protein